MINPEELQYTAGHEWLGIRRGIATVGITRFAADALGNVVLVQLPPLGSVVQAGEACGEITSAKSMSDLFAPAEGEVLDVNSKAIEDPAVVTMDPFGDGWLFKLRLLATPPPLLDSPTYDNLTARP